MIGCQVAVELGCQGSERGETFAPGCHWLVISGEIVGYPAKFVNLLFIRKIKCEIKLECPQFQLIVCKKRKVSKMIRYNYLN